jgi:hypothetical protein
MHRTAVLPSLPFPVILAALSLAPGPGRSSSPNYHGFAAPISHVAVVAKAGPLVCRRPPPGSVVSDPPAFFSHGGKLNIDLDYISSVDGKGRRLFCFVTPGGLESPTLHVRPGDWLNIHLTNKVDPSLHAEPGAMAMIMGPDRCGAATMNATSVNMHFHGTNASPTCHADEVIHTLVNSGESFDYHVKIPGSQPPGLYWYHPHVHGQSEAAVKGGASGAMVVDGIENLAPIVAGLPERTLIVRDQIVSGDSPPGGAAPTSDVTLNYVPIAYPALTPAVIRIKPGRKEFWRVLNASAETVLDVALTYDGVEQPMKVVALDGVATGSRYGTSAGKVLTMSHIVIPAAGRAEFVVTGPPASVQGATLATRSIAMGPDGDIDIARPLARLEVDRAARAMGCPRRRPWRRMAGRSTWTPRLSRRGASSISRRYWRTLTTPPASRNISSPWTAPSRTSSIRPIRRRSSPRKARSRNGRSRIARAKCTSSTSTRYISSSSRATVSACRRISSSTSTPPRFHSGRGRDLIPASPS